MISYQGENYKIEYNANNLKWYGYVLSSDGRTWISVASNDSLKEVVLWVVHELDDKMSIRKLATT